MERVTHIFGHLAPDYQSMTMNPPQLVLNLLYLTRTALISVHASSISTPPISKFFLAFNIILIKVD